jgi:ribosomal protein S18 acetylase RimI-like enzyme
VNSSRVVVRRATTEDAHGIAVVHVAGWQAAYRDLLPHDYLAGISVSSREQEWRTSLDSGRPSVLVAGDDRAIIGWAAFGDSRDEDTLKSDGELWAIYLRPDYWGRGIGQQLWREASRKLSQSGCATVSVWVLAENKRAIRFYIAAGFGPEPTDRKIVTIAGRELEELRLEFRFDSSV